MKRVTILSVLIMMIVSACGGAPTAPTAAPTLTPFPTREPQATRTTIGNPAVTSTPLFNNNQVAPTPIIRATAFVPATAAPVTDNFGTRLNNGRGLTNGQVMTNGEFQVEGYCTLLNSSYGVDEDGVDWFCTFQDQRALTIQQDQFNEICQRTYNDPNAVAIQVNQGQALAYQWRCYELASLPTATSSAPPQLASNGRGMVTGSIMNNGEFEVEGYCRSINASYGVDADNNFWYCTENGTRILTLGVAEFDDICIRTYNNPRAYSEQIQNSDRPAYRWRCFVIGG
ncbi:MAG: hypothetical protein Phog2KO_14730 [Phototrophicaceae bacterium]